MKLRVYTLVTTSIAIFINSPPVHAGIPIGEQLDIQGNALNAVFKIQHLEPLILGIANLLLTLAGLTMFVCAAWSGIQWLTAGDPSNTQVARDRLTNCVLGLSIVAIAFAIQIIIQLFFGINIFPTG